MGDEYGQRQATDEGTGPTVSGGAPQCTLSAPANGRNTAPARLEIGRNGATSSTQIIARVRQWVLSVPKPMRYFLQRDDEVLDAALRIFMRAIEDSRPPWRGRLTLMCRPNSCQSHRSSSSISASTGDERSAASVAHAGPVRHRRPGWSEMIDGLTLRSGTVPS